MALAENVIDQKTIAKMGGIKVILDAVKRHESNADVQHIGVGTLANLAVNATETIYARRKCASTHRQWTVDYFEFYYLYHTHNFQQSPNLILD